MVKQRNEIDEKYQWDLSTIFESDEAWEKEYTEILSELEKIKNYEGHVLDSAASLLEITELQLGLMRRVENIYVYAHMKNDQDTRVATYQALDARAHTLYTKFGQAFSFYEPELLKLDESSYQAFLSEEENLRVYSHYFERIFLKKEHILSQREEEILVASEEIFNSGAATYSVLDNADQVFPLVQDEQGKEVQLTHGNYISLVESKDRKVRKGAYEALYSVYKQYQNTYAKTLSTNVKYHNLNARLRHFSSAREAALSQNFIPESVFETLVKAVNKHLPLFHRYIKLRASILKLDDFKMYDMYTPLSDADFKFSYEEALKKSEEVLSVLGEDYKGKVHKAFTERWIDVYENQGKRSGAYSGGAYDTNAFMLLNWQDTLDNMFTLVHETGHSMHSVYTRETQPYVYGDYSIFLAEIASTTNENILTEHLLNEVSDDKERFAILNHYLDGFRGTIFRQTQFAEFEHAIHKADQEGTVLTSDFLNQLYAEINEKYYDLNKEENPEIQYEWARIPHFYYNYYVYQYSTGFAAASALANKIVHGSQEDRDKYLDYLKAGNSDYPLNVINKAGVDMEKEDYLNEAFAIFEKRLNELESLIEKLDL